VNEQYTNKWDKKSCCICFSLSLTHTHTSFWVTWHTRTIQLNSDTGVVWQSVLFECYFQEPHLYKHFTSSSISRTWCAFTLFWNILPLILKMIYCYIVLYFPDENREKYLFILSGWRFDFVWNFMLFYVFFPVE